LEDDSASLDAWQQWSRLVPLDHVDHGSAKLLPLLCRRLQALGVESPDLKRLKGIVFYHRARYLMLMRELVGVLRAFNEAGISTLLLKGIALNLKVYPSAARPMDDLDVWVPRKEAVAAVEVLQRQGWKSEYENYAQLIEVTHSLPFQKQQDEQLDLHWDFCYGRFLDAPSQQELWRFAEPVEVAGQKTRVLCPADQLLHTCEHGVCFNETAPVRWLADALFVIRHAGKNLDWNRLAGLASRHELMLAVRDTLGYLERHCELEVPDDARRELMAARPGVAVRMENFLRSRKPAGPHSFWRTLPTHLFYYRRLKRTNKRLRLGDYLRLVNNMHRPVWRHLPYLLRLCARSGFQTLRGKAQAGCRRLLRGLRASLGSAYSAARPGT
jgi:hypothetical protein